MLRTRADLSYALVHNLELLTHYAKRAENERCFSRQNRDEKKTEMRKNIQVARRDHRKSKFGLRHANYRYNLALLRDEVRILIFDDPAELEA